MRHATAGRKRNLTKRRTAKRTLILTALFFITLVWQTAPTRALVGDTDGFFGLDGSIRTMVMAVDNFDSRPLFAGHRFDTLSQTILRLTAAGRPRSGLAYEVHLVQAYTFSSARGGGGAGWFGSTSGRSRYRLVNLTRDWYQDRDHLATLWFDRMNLKVSLAFADLTVGRQAITFGKAYFWNPLDLFLPFDPRQFDRDYKAGVDAVRLDIALGRFSGINLIAAFGRELNVWGTYLAGDQDLRASWYGSALLARAFTTFRNWDLAVQGGKIYGGYQLGGAVVGEIWTVQVRAEGAAFWVDGRRTLPAPYTGDLLKDHVTAVIGLGRRFESSLDVEAEYLYNGSGQPGDLTTALARVAGGGSLHLGRHLLGLTLSYDILPILTGRLAVLYSISDSSIQVQPILTWSLSDNASLILGMALNRGRRPETGPGGLVRIRSEFGTYPDYYYLQFKYYF